MPISSSSQPKRVFGTIAGLAAALVLAGCAAESAPAPSESDSSATSVPGAAECTGVSVVVEFGSLEAEPITECADVSEPITAVQAFEAAGVELTEGQAYPGSICRVEGEPAADRELSYSGERYTENCSAMGPVWAYWGLFVDLGAGWEYAQEGAATQLVEPGQGIAFAWQFGDTTDPQIPAA
ncbi:hypothetical protein [Leucobacter sp. W1153]|uniref:hypothetical protein n=1 Tax=unclassified Leucobacter TaxID=2621730 RepID=UPI003F3C330C